ncbi:MAG TPA: cytochrome c oxidase assembly protein [Candidatus Nitrosocosmicus sp.]|nr:cytochrome c oxidase assembly protein [Candidatus Nitrosocosmicus sp.]
MKLQKPSNVALGLGLALLVCLMFSFAYANVPLFKMFCARFGLNDAGKAANKEGELAPLMSSAAGNVLARNVNVKFMGVSGTSLPVRFGPSEPQMTVKIGKSVHLSYTFTNMGDDSVFFRAVHSITPMSAAREFQLIQCFCFEDQSLGPRETRVLPVYFALSPRFPTNVNEMVLNYSLFPRDPKQILPVPAKEVN